MSFQGALDIIRSSSLTIFQREAYCTASFDYSNNGGKKLPFIKRKPVRTAEIHKSNKCVFQISCSLLCFPYWWLGAQQKQYISVVSLSRAVNKKNFHIIGSSRGNIKSKCTTFARWTAELLKLVGLRWFIHTGFLTHLKASWYAHSHFICWPLCMAHIGSFCHIYAILNVGFL